MAEENKNKQREDKFEEIADKTLEALLGKQDTDIEVRKAQNKAILLAATLIASAIHRQAAISERMMGLTEHVAPAQKKAMDAFLSMMNRMQNDMGENEPWKRPWENDDEDENSGEN